ncbi:MAG: MlaD family protein [Chloroflexota bacterium]|jgi:phospholipid/cholesterol/gamma-HCH transport system substrate-binding protein|nr:MlaD family protein [Lentimicrobium sp.]
MGTHSQKFKVRLGLFITGGLLLFAITIFIIGRQQNLFNPVIIVNSDFYNVSGLQVGNNVRFSGINIGSVDNITILNDSTVRVEMLIRKEVQKFIKIDSEVSIGSEGLIGDKLIVISQGSSEASSVPNGYTLFSNEPVETDAIIASLGVTAGYAEVIANQMAEIMIKINSGQGALGQLIQDSTFAKNLNQTMVNLRQSSKGLQENMEAAKSNILLRGFFKKKDKEKKRKEAEAEEKKD